MRSKTLAAAVVVLATSSCGFGQAGTSVGTQDDIAVARSVAREVDRVTGSLGEVNYAWLLVQLEGRCIEERGGRVPDRYYTSPPTTEPDTIESVSGSAWLDSPGHSLSERVEDPIALALMRQQTSARRAPDVQLPEDSEKIRVGSPEEWFKVENDDGSVVEILISGCVGAAVQKLYGVDAAVFHTSDQKIRELHRISTKVASNKAVTLASQAYAECMLDKGWQAKFPGDVPDRLQTQMQRIINKQAQPESMRDIENEYVTADLDCREKHRVSEVYAYHYLREVDEARRDVEGALGAMKEWGAHAETVAEQYVKDHLMAADA